MTLQSTESDPKKNPTMLCYTMPFTHLSRLSNLSQFHIIDPLYNWFLAIWGLLNQCGFVIGKKKKRFPESCISERKLQVTTLSQFGQIITRITVWLITSYLVMIHSLKHCTGLTHNQVLNTFPLLTAVWGVGWYVKGTMFKMANLANWKYFTTW